LKAWLHFLVYVASLVVRPRTLKAVNPSPIPGIATDATVPTICPFLNAGLHRSTIPGESDSARKEVPPPDNPSSPPIIL
jgi:hypothetical protein